jgi:cell division protein FtsL
MALKEFFSFKVTREFGVLLFFIVVTFFFVVYETEQMGVSQLQVEVSETEKKIKMAKLENERLIMEIEDLKTDVGVVRLARERLRLVFPGEIVVKAVSSEEVQIQKMRNRLASARKTEEKPVKREEITSYQPFESGGGEVVESVNEAPGEDITLDDIQPDDVQIGDESLEEIDGE